MTPPERQSVERPIAAFVLSLLAGLGLLARSGMMMSGGMHGAWRSPMGPGPGTWGPLAFGPGWPWLAPIAGIVLLAAAVALVAGSLALLSQQHSAAQDNSSREGSSP